MASYDFTFVRRCQVILSLSGVPVFCEGPRYKIEDHTSGNLGPEEVPGIGELRGPGYTIRWPNRRKRRTTVWMFNLRVGERAAAEALKNADRGLVGKEKRVSGHDECVFQGELPGQHRMADHVGKQKPG